MDNSLNEAIVGLDSLIYYYLPTGPFFLLVKPVLTPRFRALVRTYLYHPFRGITTGTPGFVLSAMASDKSLI